MKAFLIVLGLIVGIYLFLTPFRKHFNTIELQNETIIQKVDENLNVLEELGQADTFLYTKTNFNNKIFVKNERDFDLIKSLPYYQNNVELVKEFPNE